MSNTGLNISSNAHLVSTYVTLRVSTTSCSLSKSNYEHATSDFQKILQNKLNISIIDAESSDGIPVDICYYLWEYDNTSIPKETQREVALINYSKNIDVISGHWLLNQDRFLSSSNSEEKIPHPLIHIPYRSVSSKKVLHKHFPRYANVMDDSIWNFLLLLNRDIKEQFSQILEQIRQNAFIDKYYYLNIAQEYAHLESRIIREAFILNDGKRGNHGAYISPFLFHSETSLKAIGTSEISKYKWRFLLLDDKIDNTKESGKLSSCDPVLALTKSEILKNRISQIGIGSCDYILAKNVNYDLPPIKDCKIQVICVETILEALNLMRKYEFDIILLDYLLKDDYGYRLLSRIKNEITEEPLKKYLSKNNVDEKLSTLSGNTLKINDFYICDINDDAFSSIVVNPKVKCIDLRETHIRGVVVDRTKGPFKNIGDDIMVFMPIGNSVSLNTKDIVEKELLKGPQRKFFFMFISAFTTAVNERLTLESLSREEDYWLIGEGACPTNTPELFKYRLVHLMARRLNQTGIIDLSVEKILNTVKEIFSLPAEEENKERTDRIKYIRKRAYDNYRIILGLHYDYFILKDEDQGKSCLVDSFLKDKVHMGAMLEHLLQLVHLTAFGTVRQWPEIWEEYQYFVRTFVVKDENKKDLNNLTKDIEKYIIDLKSNE